MLVAISAVWAFPNELSAIFDNLNFAVIAADLAIIRLGIQLCVHDIFIDELNNADNRRNVLRHVWRLNVADGTTGRKSLKLRLKTQLGEGVDGFAHIDVVGIRNVVMVGNLRHNAELGLECLSKFVGRRLQRRAVEGVVDILRFLPLRAFVVHFLHDGQSQRLTFLVCVAVSCKVVDRFIESGVTQGNCGVSVVKQLVDGLTLCKAGQSAVLPQNRRDI